MKLIKNVKLFISPQRANMTDILIDDGKIAQIAPNISADCETYDMRGLYALPSFIDMHVHLREPGQEYKEDIETGSEAGVHGGYGVLCAMPNTNPVCDNPDTVTYVRDRGNAVGKAKIFPIGAITKGSKGTELVDFDALREAGAIAFSDDGVPVSNSKVFSDAMKICAEKNYLLISHSEDKALTDNGVINEGPIAQYLSVKGIPNSSEEAAIARDVTLAAATGARLHIAHVSTAGSVEIIRQAKKHGVRVTCETCPHYFVFSEDDVLFYGSNAKMSPPLRSKADRAAIIDGICDGTIDVISTDHAPHSPEEKKLGLIKAPNGILGLQTAFSAAYTYLVLPGYISLYDCISLFSTNPARILGITNMGYGEIKEGMLANITLVDPNEEYIFTKEMIKSKSQNTPFSGLVLCGTVKGVFYGGNRVL